MWNRILLKERGKAAFKRNYWQCVVVALIAVVILGTTFSSSARTNRNNTLQSSYTTGDVWDEAVDSLRSAPVRFSLTGGFSFSLLHIFVFSVVEIGCSKFFIRNAEGQADLNQVLDGFRSSYGKNVLTMFLVRLFISLWTLLLIIPGIVKAYAYMLVPYILADTPEISRKDALTLSEELMRGNKMDAFALDLSFIGWHLLNAVTCGIVGVFYVNPYVHATKAELYRTLRYQKHIES